MEISKATLLDYDQHFHLVPLQSIRFALPSGAVREIGSVLFHSKLYILIQVQDPGSKGRTSDAKIPALRKRDTVQ